MGSGGGVWEANDLISSARMNQKTTYIGASEPATMYAGMIWHDTSIDEVKIRNAANNAWITIIKLIFVASDNIFQSNDAGKSVNSTTMTKKKEIKVNRAMKGTIRIYFELKTNNATYGVAQGQIYKNGSPIGTLRQTSSTTYIPFTEDLAVDLLPDDLLQIYIRDAFNSIYTAATQYFRLKFDIQILNFTNQDP